MVLALLHFPAPPADLKLRRRFMRLFAGFMTFAWSKWIFSGEALETYTVSVAVECRQRQLKISTLISYGFMVHINDEVRENINFCNKQTATKRWVAAINYFKMDIKWKRYFCHSISSRCRITKSDFSFNFSRKIKTKWRQKG